MPVKEMRLGDDGGGVDFVPLPPDTLPELLPLISDVVFKAVVASPDILSPVLSDLLESDVSILAMDIAKEKEFAAVESEISSCRLDVFCRTVDGRLVDVELQVASSPNILKRARFYSAALDVYNQDTDHGRNYDLHDSLVVFFCSRKAMPCTGESLIWGKQHYYNRAGTEVISGDGREIIFVCYEDYTSLRLHGLNAFCKTLAGEQVLTDYGNLLYSKLKQASGLREVRDTMLTREQLEKALHEGLREGELRSNAKKVCRLYREYRGRPITELAERLAMTEEEVRDAVAYCEAHSMLNDV